MKIWFLILVSLLSIPLTAKGATPISADEVVKRLEEVQAKTKDFSADIHQEKKLSLLKDKIVSRGRIRFKKPDKVSIEFFHPESSQMVFDGKTVLLYYKEERSQNVILFVPTRLQSGIFFSQKIPFRKNWQNGRSWKTGNLSWLWRSPLE
jgi:outer membrane lipoprotein carrier protein